MKKMLCFLLCLTLIFSSVSLCFADEWSQSQISSVTNNLTTIVTTLSNIYTRVNTISNALFDSNHSVAYWVTAIDSWMQPIYQSLTSNLAVNLGLEPIISGLNQVITDASGGGATYVPWLKQLYDFDHVSGYPSPVYLWYYTGSGQLSSLSWSGHANWRENLFSTLSVMNSNQALFSSDMYNSLSTGYNSIQNSVNWSSLSTSTFTPSSFSDGVYKWFSAIQAPVARLSYVLASDERIEAQEAAAANEEAVVDNFIDSNGDGSMSPSNIGSVSDLSAGYKQNFGTDASPSGIFDIFNADHASWFSQETKNQLDTTTPTRLTKGSMSETPLLDKQIEDIYDALGVKQP